MLLLLLLLLVKSRLPVPPLNLLHRPPRPFSTPWPIPHQLPTRPELARANTRLKLLPPPSPITLCLQLRPLRPTSSP
jgi:hypothetical protein